MATRETPSVTLAYNGDFALEDALKKAKSKLSVADVRRLAAGVLAAPEGEDPDSWLQLVAPILTPATAGQLRALKQSLASAAQPAHGLEGWSRERVSALRSELVRRGLAEAEAGLGIPAEELGDDINAALDRRFGPIET